MAHTVQVTHAYDEPGGVFTVCAIIDGITISVSVLRADLDALPDLASKRAFLAGRVRDRLQYHQDRTPAGLIGTYTIP